MNRETVPSTERSRSIANDLLSGCLKKGLAELCQEKPAEPVRWLAQWLLANNPNKPKVILPPNAKQPDKGVPPSQPASVAAIFEAREGHTLSSHVTLVAEKISRSENIVYPMPGAPGFLKATGFNVGIVGQSNIEGCTHVIEAMQQSHGPTPEVVVWISIRSETIVYLQGEPYVLRDLAHPDEPFDRHVQDGDELANLEDELKWEVEEEISKQRGRLYVHNSDRTGQWQSITQGSVKTPHEAIPLATPRTQAFLYRPVPLPSSGPLSRDEIKHILHAIAPPSQGHSRAVVISSQYGCSCKPLVAVAACMAERVSRSDGALPQDVIPVEPLPLTRKWSPPRRLLEDVPAVQMLIQGLGERGAPAKQLADDTIDKCNVKPHLREAVLLAQEAAGPAAKGSSHASPMHEALRTRVRIYLQVVAIAGVLLAGDASDALAEGVLDSLELALDAA